MTSVDLDESVLKRLGEQVGEDTIERLVVLFRQNVRERLAALGEAFEAGDRRGLEVALHSIKGSAQLVGARGLEEISTRWEQEARSGELESVAEALAELAGSFGRVEAALGAAGPTDDETS